MPDLSPSAPNLLTGEDIATMAKGAIVFALANPDKARLFTPEMALAAARAIADVVGENKINTSVIVPSVFDSRVAPAVAAAIRQATQRSS